MRSPNWSKNELKLALELYLTIGSEQISKTSKKSSNVVALSKILRGLDTVPEKMDEKYRSANSIHLKLMNFHSLDNAYSGVAMSNVSTMDKEVWNKYHSKLPELRVKLSKYLNKHFVGKKTPDVKQYIERLGQYSISKAKVTSSDGDSILLNINSTVEYLEFLIKKQTPSEQKNRLLELCSEFHTVLGTSAQDLDKSPEPVDDYKQHGGTNQKALDSKEEKIGKHVCTAIDNMISERLLDSDVIRNLTDQSWCKTNLKVSYPVLKRVVDDISIDVQRKNKDGYLRYYKRIYDIAGEKFLLCKEWYEKNRNSFNKWVDTIYKAKNKLNVNEEELEKLLSILKRVDSKKIFIEETDLREDGFGNAKEHLDRLVEMGVLSYYQGSRTQYVIDDYDLLYDIMNNLSKFAGGE